MIFFRKKKQQQTYVSPEEEFSKLKFICNVCERESSKVVIIPYFFDCNYTNIRYYIESRSFHDYYIMCFSCFKDTILRFKEYILPKTFITITHSIIPKVQGNQLFIHYLSYINFRELNNLVYSLRNNLRMITLPYVSVWVFPRDLINNVLNEIKSKDQDLSQTIRPCLNICPAYKHREYSILLIPLLYLDRFIEVVDEPFTNIKLFLMECQATYHKQTGSIIYDASDRIYVITEHIIALLRRFIEQVYLNEFRNI